MNMHKLKYSLFFLGIILLSLGSVGFCSDTELARFKGEKQVLRISGGTAHIPVMKMAAQKIMTYNPDLQITIAGGGSGAGIKQVGEGIVNIGNSGRKATESEITKYGLTPYKWAIDGVAAVVNPKNLVKALTRIQLQEIFAGKITSWKQVGGNDKPIHMYTRDAASGTRSVFWKKALNKIEITSRANVVVSNGAMKTAVANDPYSIGYMSVGFIDDSVSAPALDGVKPTMETIRNGQYTVARGLYSNTKGEAQGMSKKFIDYLMGPDGQNMAAQKGFIPVN